MSDRPNLLFSELDLRAVLEDVNKRAAEEVDKIPEAQFRQSSDDEVVAHVKSKYEVTPLELHENRMTMETRETEVDVRYDRMRAVFDRDRPCMIPAVGVTIEIPFTGDPALWKCQPSTYSLNPPRAHVRSQGNNECGHLVFSFTQPADSVQGDKMKKEIDGMLHQIREYLERMRRDVEGCNSGLPAQIQAYVSKRRERLGKFADVAKALNIPLKHKPGTPDVSPLPVKRRLVKPLPAPDNRPPEPGIRDEDYAFILSVVRHEGRTFEATPRTFAVHNEEELRDIILAHLNGHFQGDATGETFRKSGKTDIRIEDKSRAAFVGECKIWRGAKELTQAVDQLLGYLTWRDCKAALILFNKDVAGFSSIQGKVPEVLREHPKYVREVNSDQAGEWRFVCHSAEDDQRLVTVHVFLFNLFVATDQSTRRGMP